MARWQLVIFCMAATGCGGPTVAQAPQGERAETAPSDSFQVPAAKAPTGPRAAGGDWPTFLGPTGDGKSPETGILTKWPESGLALVWQKPLGEGYGAPTISGGRLYQFDRFGNQARLYCLDALTGQPRWEYEYSTDYRDMYGYNNGPRCSPVVDGDRVYAYGVDGMLVCCRADDGKLLWQVDTAKDFGVIQNFFGVGSTPVIEGDNLIVMVGGSPPEAQRIPRGSLDRVDPNGTAIVAFDKRTGKVMYKLGDDLASYASLKLATIGERRWCFAFCRGGLLSFDPASGQQHFHYPWRAKTLESVNASVPVVAGDEVLISECYGPGSTLLRVAPGTHEVVWKDDDRSREKAMQTHWNTPIHVDGYAYGCSGRHTQEAELRCIEWKTGKVMWSQPGMSRTSLTWIDGHFLCLGEHGQLWLLKANPEKYEEVATINYGDPDLGEQLTGKRESLLAYPCWAAPIVSHGLLYVRGDGRLLCLDLIPAKE